MIMQSLPRDKGFLARSLMAVVRNLMLLTSFALISSCGLQDESFPNVQNDKLLITLQRTGCFGSCPDYKVTIDGDGNVTFATRPPLEDEVAAVHRTTGVRVSGTYQTVITKTQVASLVDRFKAADFFALKDEYRAEITDNPTYILSIETGNGGKTVLDYVGEKVGMPMAVTSLQDSIDKTAGTDKWIKGLPSVIPFLEAEKADFSGILGLELVDAAAEREDIDTLQKLQILGAPLFIEDEEMHLGPTPLRSAIMNDHNIALAWLLKNGALEQENSYVKAIAEAVEWDNHGAFEILLAVSDGEQLDPSLATRLLTKAASNADPTIVSLLLAKGANPNGPKEAPGLPDPPLFEAANGILSNDDNHPIQDRRKVVRILLDAGASISYCLHGHCQSPFWLVSDRKIAKMLLDAGADPNYRDDEGEHILFSISDEDVALLLIESGADLKAIRPADSKTLRGWAEYKKWPKVIEILDRSGL